MNKKILGLVIFIVLIAIVGGIIFAVTQNNKTTNETNTQVETAKNTQISQNREENTQVNSTNAASTNNNGVNNETESTGKVLVVYYSASGNTKNVAQKIANNLNADIFEIEPKNPYTSDDLNWNDNNSRTSVEYRDSSKRNVELKNTKVDNWENFDTVIIGYPIWWGIAAWPVNTFVNANNFDGKTVIPFCTSSSSGLGQSGSLLAQEAGTGNWQTGIRFSSNPSDSTIKTWTEGIK